MQNLQWKAYEQVTPVRGNFYAKTKRHTEYMDIMA